MSPFVEARQVSVYITILRRFYAAPSRSLPVGGTVAVALHEALCYNVTDIPLEVCVMPLISVVVPCYNEEEVLGKLYDELTRVAGLMDYVDLNTAL